MLAGANNLNMNPAMDQMYGRRAESGHKGQERRPSAAFHVGRTQLLLRAQKMVS